MKRISVLVLLVIFVAGTIPQVSVSAAGEGFNYVDAFAKSILFYEANWCGPDAGNNRLKWRGPCHIEDGKDVGADLTGGFHDCGDHVKFGLPQCASASTLGWAYYEFKDAFVKHGQDQYMLNILKHFNDYFMRCFTNKTTFHYQVGDGDIDHAYWGPPELQTYNRPTYYTATPSNPGSDVAGDAAASLALMYLNCKDEDPEYANKCLSYAKDLFSFGMAYRGNSKGQSYYGPKDYYDELMWGAVWLYVATNDKKYMDNIESLMAEKGIGGDNMYNDHWTQCWDYVFTGVFIKLAKLSTNPKYKKIAEEHLDYWINGLGTTPGGLKYLDSWGVCKYPVAEAMVQLVYYKETGDKKYLDFAKSQCDYVLGKNPNNMSYVVGFGENYPKFPHHRAASGRLEGPPSDEKKEMPERHILYGALVGGADKNDQYIDICKEYVYTETGLDYNAGLVGAMAGLSMYLGEGQVPEETPGIEGEPDEYYVEGKVTKEDSQSSVIQLNMYNIITSPPRMERGLSMRYYMDFSEYAQAGYNPADFKTNIYYTPNGAKLSPITAFDKAKNIYYIEVTFPDQDLYIRSYVEFSVAYYNNNLWKPSNDYSRQDINTNAFTRTDKVTIHKDGEIIYGKDPAGNGPSVKPSPTPTVKPSPTKTTGSKISEYIYPDFTFNAAASDKVLSGFKVEVDGTVLSALTDKNGYYEILNVPDNASGYTLKISKTSYLQRKIENVIVNGDIQVSTEDSPTAMWAGDIARNGIQDGAINISDVMEVAKCFNSSVGDGRYVKEVDINMDNAVNINDIIIVAKHFNKASGDY
jgi:hypothetical protein